jgi:hypothetical protein
MRKTNMAFFPTVQPLATYQTSTSTPSDSMTTSLFSQSVPLSTENQFLTTAVWTGTPVGTIKVMGSIDNVNFYIPIDSIATGGESGSRTYELAETSLPWVRIEYAFTSGSGTLSCKMSTKAPS